LNSVFQAVAVRHSEVRLAMGRHRVKVRVKVMG